MGSEYRKIEVVVRLGRHNSEDDRLDDRAADDLRDEIEKLARTPEYDRIEPEVWG